MKTISINRIKDFIEQPTAVVWLLALVMAYHVYEFSHTEPFAVRLLISASVDILAIFFYNRLIRTTQKRVAWAAIIMLLCFQIYVNVWNYWEPDNLINSVIKGSFFPISFGMAIYFIQGQYAERDDMARREQKRIERKNRTKGDNITASPTTAKPSVLAKKVEIVNARQNGESPAEIYDRFKKYSNRRSVQRWINEHLPKETT